MMQQPVVSKDMLQSDWTEDGGEFSEASRQDLWRLVDWRVTHGDGYFAGEYEI